MDKSVIDPIFRKLNFSFPVSALAELPRDGRAQIVIAGKSNAGKSSLINKLATQKNLARTSSEAGKTRQLLFFDTGGLFYLVDLPGYGFSRSSQTERESFSQLTDRYLCSDAPIALILLLMDARHLPGTNDLLMLDWLQHSGRPSLLLLNKADKLSNAAAQRMRAAIQRDLREKGYSFPEPMLVSAQSGQGLPELSRQILMAVDEAGRA